MVVVYAGMYVAMIAVMMIAMVVAAIGYLIFSAVISHPSPHTTWVLAICGIAIYIGVMSVFSACLWAGFAASLSVIYNDQRLRIALPSQNSSSAGALA